MSTTETQDIVEILNRIESWPRPKRVFLAQRILESTNKEHEITRGVSADQAAGLLRTVGSTPSDAECQTMLEEELLAKYGR